MINEPPYSTAKKLIHAESIGNLSELLETIPKTSLALSMKTSPKRFNKLIANPRLFTFGDVYIIAELIGVEGEAILKIIHAECILKK